MDLRGIRVLDLTRLLPGPYATQLFADLGADVVKVEDAGTGDYARHMPPRTDEGVGAVFDAVNRGKRSVGLDLKSEGGREALAALVEEADVVFEQFRPGVAERLGADYETVREHNPEVVYCSLTGYGQTGPEAQRAGHDLNYVGRAGLLDMTRPETHAPPVMPGYQVADLAGGLFAAFAIASALLAREHTGEGTYVDVGMTDVVLSFSQALAPQALAGDDPRPRETPLTGAYPWYDVYEAKDGNYVTFAALEPPFWAAFCEAVEREDLRSLHGTEDEAELAALREALADTFLTRTREEWVEAFRDVDGTVDGVYTPGEAVEHPQFVERGMVERGDGSPRLGFPAVVDRPGSGEWVPGHGEHTDEVLSEAGLSAERLAALRDAGAIR
ncbi:CaiB/BaiF CoA transferase family protein [Halomarina ordinaria]|uniref:CaiB/BaiF CoA transferase family protein n=1 Tax=Halomarina ordinaria TaxID=3033939 RepID=A0ABD5U9N6_9EURY|nr:CaiB/BaiF CoA-transferase family protein [Halomarina sp. PSRA2]